MKVNGTRPIDQPTVRRAERRAGGSDAFKLEPASTDRGAAPVAQAAPLTALDALIALQAVPDAMEGRRRAVKRAGDMLDLLDDIRLSLLEGLVPKGKLEGLLRAVQSRRDAVADPMLASVLDEIELRARVELAKFGAPA